MSLHKPEKLIYANRSSDNLHWIKPLTKNKKQNEDNIKKLENWGTGTCQLIDNKPLSGFKIKYFTSRSQTNNKHLLVVDPRGWDYEITIQNFIELVRETTIIKGEIQEECVYFSDGSLQVDKAEGLSSASNFTQLREEFNEYLKTKRTTLNKSETFDIILSKPSLTRIISIGEVNIEYTKYLFIKKVEVDVDIKLQNRHKIENITRKYTLNNCLLDFSMSGLIRIIPEQKSSGWFKGDINFKDISIIDQTAFIPTNEDEFEYTMIKTPTDGIRINTGVFREIDEDIKKERVENKLFVTKVSVTNLKIVE